LHRQGIRDMEQLLVSRNPRNPWRAFGVGFGVLMLLGPVWADSVDSWAAYVLITMAAVLPLALWLRAGALDIPVLPAVAGFHYLYFALPILRQNVGTISYSPSEIFNAAATVILFLIAATIGWRLLIRRSTGRLRSAGFDVASGHLMHRLTFLGLTVGILFQLIVMAGWHVFFGTYFGLFRAIALGLAMIGSYMLGSARASGVLRGRSWVAGVVAIGSLILLFWSSLFLVVGMQFALAAVLGYSITARRIPYAVLIPGVIIVFILHAGKMEMRDRYWSEGYSEQISIWEVPRFFSQWAVGGMTAIAAGRSEQGIIDRASLLYLLLKVERLTPDTVPYLGGETYMLLPAYLTPRFLDPEKNISQAGLALLSIRYGLESRMEARTTTIGWGPIAEAYANFGNVGVFCVGLLFGVLSACFTRMSTGGTPTSLRTLLSIMALVSMTNMEVDLAYMLTNLWQALAATLLFFVPVRLLSPDRNVAQTKTMAAWATQPQPAPKITA
jgi:hypothetical protein